MKEQQSNEPSRKYSPLVNLGLSIVAGMIFFSFLGYYIDQKRGGGMAATLTGIFLGLFYCGYEIWKAIRQLNREPPEENDKSINSHKRL